MIDQTEQMFHCDKCGEDYMYDYPCGCYKDDEKKEEQKIKREKRVFESGLSQGYEQGRKEREEEIIKIYEKMLKGDWTSEQLLALTYWYKKIKEEEQ